MREKVPTVGILGDAVSRLRVNKYGNFEYMQQVITGSSLEEGKIRISLLSSSSPRYGIGIFYQTGFGYCWIGISGIQIKVPFDREYYPGLMHLFLVLT